MDEDEAEREEIIRRSDLDDHAQRQGMIGLDEDTESLFTEDADASASEHEDDDAAADDSGSEDGGEPMSSGQEQLLFENDLSGAMAGGDD